MEVVKRGLQPAGGDANSLVLRVDQELSDALRVEKVGRPAGLGTVVVSSVTYTYERKKFDIPPRMT